MSTYAHHDGTVIVEESPRSPSRASVDVVHLPQRQGGIDTIVTMVLAVAVLVAVIAVATLAIVTSTIAAATPQGGSLLITMRGTHPITAVPPGEHITVTSGPRDVSWGGRLRGATGIPDTSTVLVIAGPYGAAPRTENGNALINGEDSGVAAPELLDGQYLAQCIAGSCQMQGRVVVLVEPDSVLGSPWLALSPLPSSWQPPTGSTR